jgi:hypothetical protein
MYDVHKKEVKIRLGSIGRNITSEMANAGHEGIVLSCSPERREKDGKTE